MNWALSPDWIHNEHRGWTRINLLNVDDDRNLKNAVEWCKEYNSASRWYCYYGLCSFWIEDPKIASEFAMRFALGFKE